MKTKFRGPAPILTETSAKSNEGGEGEDEDIVEEALNTFRANTFYRNFEIKGPADRTLVYCYLYIADCLSKISTLKSPSLVECTKTLTNHATASFAIPGDGNFPLNALFSSPSSKQESEYMRQYLQQLRCEISARLPERLYENNNNTLSKWWMAFSKRKFMNKSL